MKSLDNLIINIKVTKTYVEVYLLSYFLSNLSSY